MKAKLTVCSWVVLLVAMLYAAAAKAQIERWQDIRYAAIDSLWAALDTTEGQQPCFDLLIQIGGRYKDMGDKLSLAEANRTLTEALHLAEDMNNEANMAQAYALLGLVVEYTNEQLEDGVMYCSKAYELASKAKVANPLQLSCFCLSMLYMKQEKFEKALSLAQEATKVSKAANMTTAALRAMVAQGRILHKMKRDSEAKAIFREAEKLVLAQNDMGLKADFYYSLLYSVNNPFEQMEYAKKMLEYTEKTNYQRLMEGNRLLAEAYNMMGMTDSALNHFVFALDNQSKLCNVEGERQLAFAQARFKTDYTKVQNELLSAELKTRNIILVSVAGTVGLIILLLAVITYNRRKRQQGERIAKELQFRQQLLEQELKTEYEKSERERIAVQLEVQRQEQLRKEQELQTELQVASERLMVKRSILADLELQIQEIVDASTRARFDQLKMLHRSIRQSLAEPGEQEKVNQYLISANINFAQRLIDRYPDLSPAEQRLCILLRLDKSSKEIASLTNTSMESVNVARSRLRKKLGLERAEDIGTFLRQI